MREGLPPPPPVTQSGGTESTGVINTSPAAWTSATATTLPMSNTHKKRMELAQPPPSSFTLRAACHLLQDLQVGQSVYLMDREYLQNWLIWALHQRVPEAESARNREALRLAALQQGLLVPTTGMEHHDPGPIDNTSLSVQGHPLLLNPLLQVKPRVHSAMPSLAVNFSSSNVKKTNHNTPKPSHYNQRSNSLPDIHHDSHKKEPTRTGNVTTETKGMNGHTPHVNTQKMDQVTECLAVSEEFYEALRAVHGVVCDDGQSISFQSYVGNSERILLHHQILNQKMASDNQEHSSNIHSSSNSRPVEFRRKVILQTPPADTKEPASLMEKLLLEEEQLRYPNLVPTVEVHPIKLLYNMDENNRSTKRNGKTPLTARHGSSLTDSSDTELPLTEESDDSSARYGVRQGFVLVSREALAVDALLALLRVAAPTKATDAVRLWSRRLYPWQSSKASPVEYQVSTKKGDGYELVDLEALEEKKKTRPTDGRPATPTPWESPRMTVHEWVRRHMATVSDHQSDDGIDFPALPTTHEKLPGPKEAQELELLVETRKSVSAPWPRVSLELEERIGVGDMVDAQDVAGKWYEAIVRSVEDDCVTVHYVGWASKWNATIRRRKRGVMNKEGVPSRVKPPAPLWSETGRWRESVQVGDVLEVRDSSSIAERPKWYKGVVRKVGKPTDRFRELVGGANLELYEVPESSSSTKEPLLIFGRLQQILVEVEQEKSDKAGSNRSLIDDDGADHGLSPEPPFRRWVNLYGEEICQLGTHLKRDEKPGPVTLKYDYEGYRKPVEILKGHPMLGSGFMRESLRGTPPAPGSVGLHNLGNSCFLNSTVQCLNHIDPLTQFFLSDRYMDDLNRSNPLGSGGNVAMAYASLLKKMWGGEYSVLAPRSLKQTVAAFAPQFDNCHQHDSQEFCQFLMDGLHEDLNRVKKKPYVEELEGMGMEDEKAAIESWRKHLLRHDSIIVDHCQGMHRSHLTCPHCGRESIKFDVYSSISLPLVVNKDRSTIQLEACLEKFMEGEQLDERNAWYCPNCRKHVCALKMIALWTVPDILIIHLKRFTFDTCMTSGGMLRSKMDDKVDFPIENFDLTSHVLGPKDKDAPPVYNLFGVSEHTGLTANSGHYTATVRNSIDNQWYRCNDSHVGRTSGEASITGGAYLLFYQRSKGISKWGGMYKVMSERLINPYGGLETDQEGFKKVKMKKKKKGKDY